MTNREKAEAAWGTPLPDWIEKLATACDGKGLRKTAADLSVSPAIVSLAIRRGRAKLDFIRSRVEHLLGISIIPCPVLGLISRKECRDNQQKPFSSINPIEVQLFRSCRGSCLYSELKRRNAMISENLEKCLDVLDKLTKRGNDDIRELAPFIVNEMRREVLRVRELEEDVYRSAHVVFEVRGGLHAEAR